MNRYNVLICILTAILIIVCSVGWCNGYNGVILSSNNNLTNITTLKSKIDVTYVFKDKENNRLYVCYVDQHGLNKVLPIDLFLADKVILVEYDVRK